MSERRVGPIAFPLADDGRIPNNPRLPPLLWRRAVDPALGDLAQALEDLFRRNGWVPAWRNGIYAFPHYHATAHEVLGIARGRVRVRLGGASGPLVELAAGDVVLIPAGVGHERIGPAPRLLVVGAYPPGQVPDLCRSSADGRTAALDRIARLADPPDLVRGSPLGIPRRPSAPAATFGG